MPALSITAVDAGADTLTIVGHGLTTGDGGLAVYTPDGAIPGGLAPVTSYWAIKVDDDTLKLAASSSDAFVPTPVNITSTGSGTLQLLVGIPYRRTRTYVPKAVSPAGSQVKSADLNAFMDTFIALWNFLTGQAQTLWSGIKLAANQHVQVSGTGRFKHGTMTLQIPASAFEPYDDTVANFARTIGKLSPSGAGNSAYAAPINLPIGARILAVRVDAKDSSGNTFAARLNRYTAATDTTTNVATSSNSSGAGARQILATGAVAETIATGVYYQVDALVQSGFGASEVYGAEVDYDMP